MKTKTFILLAVIFALNPLQTSWVFAHGENKPGPHGGIIRMPGAYHTEVLQLQPDRLRVYLLDIQFKNPTLNDSTLQITHLRKNKKTPLTCVGDKNFFECTLPQNENFQKGDHIELITKRDGQTGGVVQYSFPLQPTKGHH